MLPPIVQQIAQRRIQPYTFETWMLQTHWGLLEQLTSAIAANSDDVEQLMATHADVVRSQYPVSAIAPGDLSSWHRALIARLATQ